MTKLLHVMEIERFALHDGPGIRTTVFLKGCPLRCPWCANPESQSMAKTLMHFSNKCVRCGACVAACKQNALTWENESPVFRRALCVGCESCREACLHDAIAFSGRPMNIESILAAVLRDRDYYSATGGGMTISGGEPFVQFEGMLELLGQARGQGLHTAIETCGQTAPEKIRQAAQYTNLFLFDFKHSDAQKLDRFTRGKCSVILENLRAALQSKAEVIARIPVIPGFNQDALPDMLDALANEGIKKAHLLPYHLLGSSKYAQIGMEYPWPEQEPIKKESLKPFIEIGKGFGLEVKIGG